MNRLIKTTILPPIVAIVVLMLLSILGVRAQSTQNGPTKTEKTIRLSFKNTYNEFYLYGVGKVIIKGSTTNDIRCEVKMTGFGKDESDARNRVNNVKVHYSDTKKAPRLFVNLAKGRYNERNCKVVTTVYLPPTVVFQHNEDLNAAEFMYRILDKLKN